jgi:hypothetical protein
MQPDINTDDILMQLRPIQQAISMLHIQGRKNLLEFNLLKRERELLQPQVGWRETYLMGYFGGNQSVAQKVKTIEVQLSSLRSNLAEVDEQLKVENDNLHRKIKEYLKKHSEFYQKLLEEVDFHTELFDTSETFYNMLITAKQNVSEALRLTSWENLINHPSAKERISKLKAETAEYEEAVQLYESVLKVDLLRGRGLKNLIKFSTQSVAMKSFSELSSEAGAIMEYADAMISENSKMRKSIIDVIKRTVKKESHK